MGNLAKRLATAAVLVPALLASLYLDPTRWSILVIAALMGALAYDEYMRMALPTSEDDRAGGLRAIGATLCAAVVVIGSEHTSLLFVALSLFAVVLGTAILARKSRLPDAGRHLGVSLAGLLYVGVLVAVLPPLKATGGEGAADWLTVTLCLAFFSDTVAYAFGRSFGRHKMYPAVSPKKTWEGSAGGFVGGVLATVGVGSSWLLPELPIAHAIGLGVIGSAAGQVGDLVASMLKRTFGVKDSGKLLPGHGGALDRIDGLLFVGPVVYAYVVLVATV